MRCYIGQHQSAEYLSISHRGGREGASEVIYFQLLGGCKLIINMHRFV